MKDPAKRERAPRALVGRWKTEGWTWEHSRDPAARVDAIDTRAEIIGYDQSLGRYATQYFGSDGPTAYEATFEEVGDALVWKMGSETTRFTGTFGADGNTISGRWDMLDEGSEWRPWMDITLTKQID